MEDCAIDRLLRLMRDGIDTHGGKMKVESPMAMPLISSGSSKFDATPTVPAPDFCESGISNKHAEQKPKSGASR